MMKKNIKRLSLLVCVTAAILTGCQFFASFKDPPKTETVEISGLTMSKVSLAMKVGSMDYVTIKVTPSTAQKECKFTWTYDEEIISCDTSSAWGVTIKAIKEGQTSLKCSYGGYDATCIITVSGFEEGYEQNTEPYIYSNTTILQTAPGVSERVYVSLFGGDASDIDGYTWTIDNPSVASIEPTGQYCLVTAKDAGYARIKITHSKAVYPYYMGIYVFTDITKVTYITTENNIVTMNMDEGEKTVSVNLVNGKEGTDSQFKWEILSEEGNESPLGLEYNGNKAVLSPVKAGSCTVRVTHPDAAYPLDILCRVVSIVNNVYINPDKTVITLDGTNTETITSLIEGLDFSEYDIDGFRYSLDKDNTAEIISFIGNQVTLKGIANGSCKLSISHEKAKYSREVLVIVTGQLNDAIDSSCYITTNQNYIKTKVGNEETVLNIMLKGGTQGDESNFTWTVKQTPDDGNSDVISVTTVNGSVAGARAVQDLAVASAVINPVSKGTATITITHPKSYYPTEILINVLDKDAILENPLYFSGGGIVRFLNSETYDYSILLLGGTVTESEKARIEYNSSSPLLSILDNGENAVFSSTATGSNVFFVEVSHPKVQNPKKVTVLTADTEEELSELKALYADKYNYSVNKGKTVNLFVNSIGFGTYDEESQTFIPEDFSSMTWEVKDSGIAVVEKGEDPSTGIVTGISPGKTRVTARYQSYSVEFEVTVYPEDVAIGEVEKTIYLTTANNVVNITEPGKSSVVNVTGIGLSGLELANIKWVSSDEETASVIGNGTAATITAVKEGEAQITVSHPLSENTLTIYVRIGSKYIPVETEPVVYISSEDVVPMLNGATKNIQAVLVNAPEGSSESGFSFSIDNEEVARITAQTLTGQCYIKAVGSGQAVISVSHPDAVADKKILVLVGNSEEELSGLVYLTTNSNIVALGEGNSKSISVSVKNATEPVVTGYTWLSSDPAVVDVIPNGATAVLKGNSIGTATITVKNDQCKYPLTIIAQCLDPKAIAANPYIQLSTAVLTVNVGTAFSTVTADIIGGDESDYQDFVWTCNDSSVCAVYAQNEVGKIRALQSGTAVITVSHPKALQTAQLLVVADDAVKSDCYISVPSSIISMKPTDAAQTITATLINGESTDKYNFSWSMDVYDIVDLKYSANVCTIEPKQQGTATITISHPKAAYDQQIVVTVQEYSTFAFPDENKTVTQGDVVFLSMQIPTTKVTTHVEYSTDKSSIVTIQGTKSVAQLTAVGPGTTTVKAKLIASSTGVVQATAEMMVYVKEAPVNAVYITSSGTINTLQKGKSQTLSAMLSGTGVTPSDQNNLKWTTGDTDIIKINGLNTDGTIKGSQIYVTALKSGEAVITCSHEMAPSDLQFYVIVPGEEEKIVSLNKTYMTLVKGSSGSQLKATIDNSESSADYYELEWSCSSPDGNEVVRIMGSGQTVTVYPVNTGEATVMVQHPDNDLVAKCTVIVEAGKSFGFETTSKRVQPFHSVKVKYTVSPADALLTWTTSQDDDYFEYQDLGCDSDGNGEVMITGIKEGSGTLACVTDGSAKGSLSIRCAWDYSFSTDKTKIQGSPDNEYKVNFSVNPADAEIIVSDTNAASVTVAMVGEGKGEITLVPKGEASDTLIIEAKNQATGEVFGSKTCMLSFAYDTVSLVPGIINRKGSFSRIASGTFTLGDGEELTFNFTAEQEKLDFQIKKVDFQKVDGEGGELVSLTAGAAENTWVLKHSEDYLVKEYLIEEWYDPYYNGQLLDPTTFVWAWHEHNDGAAWGNTTWKPCYGIKNAYVSPGAYDYIWHSSNNDINGNFQGIIEKRRNIAKDGTRVSKEKFESTGWWYRPYHEETDYQYYKISGGSEWKTSGPWDACQTRNNPAELVNSIDTKVISNDIAGYLTVEVLHNSKTSITRIPVYTETRSCTFDYIE